MGVGVKAKANERKRVMATKMLKRTELLIEGLRLSRHRSQLLGRKTWRSDLARYYHTQRQHPFDRSQVKKFAKAEARRAR